MPKMQLPKKIENTGIRYLLIFMIISLINDYWSIKFGFPTLNHLFILYLFIKIPYPYKYHKYITPLIGALLFYLLVVFVNSIITFGTYGNNFQFMSVILKLSIFILLVPHFMDVRYKDFHLFIKYMNIALVGLVLIPGIYEWRMQSNIMELGSGLSQYIFYIRAFSIDKVDFGFNLILLISTSLTLLPKLNYFYRLVQFIIIILSLILLVFSFSTTNLLGIGISALLFILFYSKSKFLSFLMIAILISFVFITTSNMHKFYEDKYSYQESELGDNEFRSVAFVESLKLFIEAPFFGYGSESNGYLMEERISWLNRPLSSHNIMSELINFGLIGVIPVIFSLYFIAKRIVILHNYKSEVILLLLMISGPLISRLLFYFHRFDKSLYIFWLSLGVIMIFNYKDLYEKNRSYS